ncbi:MAG TPA: HAD-IC family P-type ATPase [Caulobacteraceae bacterium]|jgi:calcium-translocating P-type ATPase|nr:HAD-IC family P-type ATPase [Caulobacteraceae bacterium]
MESTRPVAWHTLEASEVLSRLDSRPEGLSEAEARRRLDRDGPNRLPEPKRPGILRVFAEQFRSPLIYVLLAATVVSAALGRWSDAAFVLVVLLVDATIGAVQSSKAEASAAALNKTLALVPTVLRDGRRQKPPVQTLVRGDVVLLEPGAAAPADLRLISSEQLRTDESLLTGESQAVDKTADHPAALDDAVADRFDMVFAGTTVLAGRGLGVVCEVGEGTELGRIARSLAAPGARPPLLLRMEAFSRRIAAATLAVVVLLAIGQALRGAPFADIFLLAVALAVSAIPEGLPVAITIALSVASARMARRGVVVRRLPAVEGLGSCTLIATDKTGTLTENRLTIKRVWLPDGSVLEVDGEGLDVTRPKPPASPEQGRALQALARAGVLANEAVLSIAQGGVEAAGDAVDVAFLVLGAKLSLHRDRLLPAAPLLSSLAYEPERGYCAGLHAAADEVRAEVKGAPEQVLAMCDGFDREAAEAAARALAAEGYRVLAVASGPVANHGKALAHDHLRGLRLLGLVGLIDPLRAEAPEAVVRCREAGVEVRMITGDHPDTARAIAAQLDPAHPPLRVVTGPELRRLEGEALDRAILEAEVYARVEPTQKRLIVETLQRHGHFVALTGDGVNDAPALQAAHVGVAMGARGADVARAAADLIIADDNFASIVNGIEEGRNAYDNIRKIVWLLISTAIAEILLFLLAIATGLPMPLTPVQILWLNLIHEGVQDAALALEGREPGLMRRPPRSPREPIFDRQMIEQCLLTGIYIGGVGFGLYWWLTGVAGYDAPAARNLLLAFLVLFDNAHVLNCRSERRSAFAVPWRANPILIASIAGSTALHVAAMYLPGLSQVLELQPIGPVEWLWTFGLASTVVAVAELYKRLRVPSLARAIARDKGGAGDGAPP